MADIAWQMPDSFPDLSDAEAISVDIETRDDSLKTLGPGVRRGGYVVGVAVATSDGAFEAYYPIRHEEGANLDQDRVFEWLSEQMSRPKQAKVGANLLYDLDYLAHAGVAVSGEKLFDVLNAEPLIDENAREYNLNYLGKKYLGTGKLTTSLEEACIERKLKGDPGGHIWQLPASVVGPYAIEDARLAMLVFEKQKKLLVDEDLSQLFALETRLIPLMLKMRQTGVRIDEDKLAKVTTTLRKELLTLKKRLNDAAGEPIDPWSPVSITRLFDRLGLPYVKTAKRGYASSSKEFLEQTAIAYPVVGLLLECRQLDKFVRTFLEKQLAQMVVSGRIHSSFNQLRGQDKGAVTGRFSSSNPNLQFIPSKRQKHGLLCRSMFIPEDGQSWGKADYDQIEFRLFAHYAVGQGSDEFRNMYRGEEEVDFHAICSEMLGVDRGKGKGVNFSLLYGMGVKGLMSLLNADEASTRAFLKEYYAKFPFMKHTGRKAAEVAESRGYVKTILSRRRRFDEWEPVDMKLSAVVDRSKDKDALTELVLGRVKEDSSLRAGVKRYGTYKALNAIIQGSSADVLKKAMVDCHQSGVFDVLTLHITVHDELDVSVPKTKDGEEAFKEMIDIMEKAVRISVPITVKVEVGKSWGELS